MVVSSEFDAVEIGAYQDGVPGSRADEPGDLRRQRGAESRRALVEATIRSVAGNGLGGTTLSTVAQLAGASRALVGFHFKSKDALLRAALDHALEIYDISLSRALAAVGDEPSDRIRAIIRHDLTFAANQRDLLALWFAVWGEAQATPLYRAEYLPYDRRWSEQMAQLAASALRHDEQAGMRAGRAINAALFGLWLECHLDPGGFDLDAALVIGLDLAERLISPSDPVRAAATR